MKDKLLALGSKVVIMVLIVFWGTTIMINAKADIFSYTDFYDETEFPEIMELISMRSGILDLSDILGPNGNDFDKISYAYKLHYLKDSDIRFLTDLNKNLNAGITADYRWILATDDNAKIEVGKENGSWEVLLLNEAPSEKATSTLIQMDALQKAISSLTVKNITAFRVELMRDTVFVNIQAVEGDFLMPFSKRPDFTKMKNGTLYTREEISSIVYQEYYDVLQAFENNENGSASISASEQIFYNGAVRRIVQPKEKKTIPLETIIAITGGCILLFGSIILTIVLVKKRERNLR